MQGSVSSIFYLCPSLNFIKCRKSFMEKIAKYSRFFFTKTEIQNLRHASLHLYFLYMS